MAQAVRLAAGEQNAQQTLLFLVNGVAQSLTGATLSATLRSVDQPSGSTVIRAATGALASTGLLGQYTYTPSAADAVAGDYELLLKAVVSAKNMFADAVYFFVRDH